MKWQCNHQQQNTKHKQTKRQASGYRPVDQSASSTNRKASEHQRNQQRPAGKQKPAQKPAGRQRQAQEPADKQKPAQKPAGRQRQAQEPAGKQKPTTGQNDRINTRHKGQQSNSQTRQTSEKNYPPQHKQNTKSKEHKTPNCST